MTAVALENSILGQDAECTLAHVMNAKFVRPLVGVCTPRFTSLFPDTIMAKASRASPIGNQGIFIVQVFCCGAIGVKPQTL